jgi:hypothetical protein
MEGARTDASPSQFQRVLGVVTKRVVRRRLFVQGFKFRILGATSPHSYEYQPEVIYNEITSIVVCRLQSYIYSNLATRL